MDFLHADLYLVAATWLAVKIFVLMCSWTDKVARECILKGYFTHPKCHPSTIHPCVSGGSDDIFLSHITVSEFHHEGKEYIIINNNKHIVCPSVSSISWDGKICQCVHNNASMWFLCVWRVSVAWKPTRYTHKSHVKVFLLGSYRGFSPLIVPLIVIVKKDNEISLH